MAGPFDVCCVGETMVVLAPDPPRLFAALKRVEIQRVGELTDDDLVVALGEVSQGLIGHDIPVFS